MKRLDEEKASRALQELMDKSVAEGHTLGGIALIHQEGKPVVEVISGKATMDGKPLHEKSVFRLASMSKNVCGIAVMQMIERGLLTVDTPLEVFYPGFKNKWVGKRTPDKKIVPDRKSEVPVTIRHLLTHTSGIGAIELTPPFTKEQLTLDNIAQYYADEGILDFEPGSFWGYSGLAGCDILGNVVERLTDMPYEEYVKKYITDPLGMVDTGFTPTEEQWSRMVDVLSHDENGANIVTDKEKHRILPLIPADYIAPGGGMVSTASDYIRLSNALANGGSFDGVRILSPEAVKTMGTPMIPQGMKGMYFPWMTFGACVYVRKGLEYIPDGCFGWGGFYGTYTWTDPENKLGVVWMKNSNVLASVIEPTGERAFEMAVYSAMV